MLRTSGTVQMSRCVLPHLKVPLQKGVSASQLNGTHGEFTCSDDVKPSVISNGPYKGMTKAQKKKAKKKEEKKIVIKEVEKQVVRAPPPRVVPLDEAAHNVRELIEAILLQRKPYVLPRYAGAYVAPHQYRWKKQITLDSDLKLRTAFLITNDLNGLLHTGTAEYTDAVMEDKAYSSYPGVAVQYPLTTICQDSSLELLGGSEFIKSSSLPVGGYVHWSRNTNKFVPGFKYYPGTWNNAPSKLKASFYNTQNPPVGSVTFTLGSVHNGIVAPAITRTQAIVSGVNAYDFATDPGFSAFATEMSDYSGWYLTYAFTAVQNESYGNYLGIEIAEMVVASPMVWRTESLWQLMTDSEIAQAQYYKASRHNVTGNAVTLTNTTAPIYKGGTIYAARLPGNSYEKIGGTLNDVIKVISCQTDHVLESSSLEFGMHYSFTPEKIQDWLFERDVKLDPFAGNPENIPFCAVAIDATGISGGSPTLTFTGIVSVEYLTVDPSNWKVSSPSNSAIFDAVLNALASENCLSENPDHLDHIAKVVRRVMTSDNMKYALKSLVQAGVKVAPFVLSML